MKLRKVITTAGFMFAGVSSANAQLYMCQSCPAGTYSDGTFTSCKTCPAGTYSSAGASSCSTCPAGYYCPGGSDKKVCPAGQYSSAKASSCTLCPVGTYSSGGKSSCSTCPTGKYSNMGARICSTTFSLMKEYYGSSRVRTKELEPGTYKIELIGGGGGGGEGSYGNTVFADDENGCRGGNATMQSQIIPVPSKSTATIIVGKGGLGGVSDQDGACEWGEAGTAGETSSFTVGDITVSSAGGTAGKNGKCSWDKENCSRSATCSDYGCGGSGGKIDGGAGEDGHNGHVYIYRLVDE